MFAQPKCVFVNPPTLLTTIFYSKLKCIFSVSESSIGLVCADCPHYSETLSDGEERELDLDYSSRPGSGPVRPITAMSHDTLRRVSSMLFICK